MEDSVRPRTTAKHAGSETTRAIVHEAHDTKMKYASLMVHMDLEPSSDARLRIAGDLADRFGSHVIGIAAGDPEPPAYGGGSFVAGLAAEQRRRIKAQLAAAERRFRAVIGSAGATAEWRQAFEKPTTFVAAQARAADLIITGAGSFGDVFDPFLGLDPSMLAVEAGRPVLIVPPQVEACEAKKVLVGWKNTPQARRAIWDALPVLQAAEYVVVGQILDPEDEAAEDDCLGDVIRWLGRHDVRAVARIMRATGDTAEVLQLMAAEEFADLIVTGAYGHSRLGEWIWGGVTQKLLTSSQFCCLVAH
jgi:nucleotide-binding universal stress UspA family protein